MYIGTAAVCIHYSKLLFTLEFYPFLNLSGCTFSTAFLVKATRKTLDSTGWLYTMDHSRYMSLYRGNVATLEFDLGLGTTP